MLQRVEGQLAHVCSLSDQGLDVREYPADISRRDRVEQRHEDVLAAVPEQVLSVVDRQVPAEARHLVEGRERVTNASLGMTSDDLERVRCDVDVLGLGDLAEVGLEDVDRDAPEVESLGARDDRLKDLVSLGGREDEDDVRRRLLEGLQERVERLGRQHVDLVDHVDLAAGTRRGESDAGQDLSGFVHLGVGGRVHLDHVEGRSVGDRDARRALPARVGRGALLAVQRLGQDAGGAGLAGPSGAGEEVGVRHPILGDGVREGLRNVLLAEDLAERLGPVLAIEG
jgi:hypothetical protein